MIRRTLTILSLIGLLLSVGTWGASQFLVRYLGAHNALELSFGTLFFIHSPHAIYGNQGWRSDGVAPLSWGIKRCTPRFRMRPSGLWSIRVPLWIPSLVFGTSFFVSCRPVRRYRLRRRRKLGLCVRCAHDLRGSKERCPECGEHFETSKLGADC